MPPPDRRRSYVLYSAIAAARAPRRVAAERDRGGRRLGARGRLRDREGADERARDARRERQGEGPVHGAGAAAPPGDRSARRRVRRGGDPLGGARGAATL